MTRTGTDGDLLNAAGWLLLGVLGGLVLDLCAKQVLADYSLTQFVLVRSAIAILIMLAFAPRFGGLDALKTREVGWHLLRSLFAIGAMFGFFYGLANMPLVNALTLGYTAPLIVTALSAIVLGDKVGWRRWTAVIVGFIGVLVMLRPGQQALTLAEAAVLVAAVCYASQAITARKLSGTESTLSLSLYIIIGPLITAALFIDADAWTTPDASGWVLMTTAAAGSVIAWVGFINGYRAVSPATLAPLEYIALVGGAVAGYLIWDEIPDRWVVVGATIIIGSGLFIVYRSEASNEQESRE